ncbi:MAG: hypothetical protein ACE5ID_10760, partial [Acidobacteriota bacterium]
LEVDEVNAFFDLDSSAAKGQGFISTGGDTGGRDEDEFLVETIEKRLQKMLTAPDRTEDGASKATLPAAAPFTRRRRRREGLLALAAILLAGVGLMVVLKEGDGGHPPPVPSLSDGPGAMRALAGPVAMEPEGDQERIPEVLAWHSRESEEGDWEVRLERVDGEIVWSARVQHSPVRLPAPVHDMLKPGSRYIWKVKSIQGGHESSAAFTLKLPKTTEPGS